MTRLSAKHVPARLLATRGLCVTRLRGTQMGSARGRGKGVSGRGPCSDAGRRLSSEARRKKGAVPCARARSAGWLLPTDGMRKCAMPQWSAGSRQVADVGLFVLI